MKSRTPKPTIINDAARLMLDHFAALNERTRAKRKLAAEPEVGIFFVYEGKPFIEGTPLSEAESQGGFTGHRTGHDAFWATLKRNGFVPPDVEYDEVARGRVTYDTKERKFYVFVDACIRKDVRILNRIEQNMNLPLADTAPPRLDSHYRCPNCSKTKRQRRQEERDWDF